VRSTLAVFALSLFLYGLPASASQTRFTINTGFTPPVSTIFEQIMQQVFERLGRPMDFQEVPAERSLILVNEGTDDAECCRIPRVVAQDYKDLVVVPESVYEVRFCAFSSRADIRVTRWDDLKPYATGTVTGWKILVNNLKRIEPREYYELAEAEAMFRMLEMGRIEVATLGYLSGLKVIKELKLSDIIRPLAPPLATRKLFMMLHKKHAAMIPSLAKILAEMKTDGSIERIVRRTVESP